MHAEVDSHPVDWTTYLYAPQWYNSGTARCSIQPVEHRAITPPSGQQSLLHHSNIHNSKEKTIWFWSSVSWLEINDHNNHVKFNSDEKIKKLQFPPQQMYSVELRKQSNTEYNLYKHYKVS